MIDALWRTSGLGLRALLLVMALSLDSSHACSCGNNYDTPADELAIRDVVFAGRVVELEEGRDPYDAQDLTFDVTAQWKGALGGQVQVHTPALGAGCGYAFDLCSQYLVYGDWQDDGRVLAHICSGTRQIADIAEGVADLGAPLPATALPTAQPCGAVDEILGTWEITRSQTDGLGAWDLLEFRADRSCVANWIWEGKLVAIGLFSFRRKSSLMQESTSWIRVASSPHTYYTPPQASQGSGWQEQGEMDMGGSYLISADGSTLVFYMDSDPVIWYQRSGQPVVDLDAKGNPTATHVDSWGRLKRQSQPAPCPSAGDR